MAILSRGLWLVLRFVAYLYITGVCIWWIADNLSAGYFNWFMASLMVTFIAGFILRRQWLERIVGILVMTGAFYMLLAVASSFNNAEAAGHTKAATNVALYGAVMFGLCFVAGSIIIVAAFSKKQSKE